MKMCFCLHICNRMERCDVVTRLVLPNNLPTWTQMLSIPFEIKVKIKLVWSWVWHDCFWFLGRSPKLQHCIKQVKHCVLVVVPVWFTAPLVRLFFFVVLVVAFWDQGLDGLSKEINRLNSDGCLMSNSQNQAGKHTSPQKMVGGVDLWVVSWLCHFFVAWRLAYFYFGGACDFDVDISYTL